MEVCFAAQILRISWMAYHWWLKLLESAGHVLRLWFPKWQHAVVSGQLWQRPSQCFRPGKLLRVSLRDSLQPISGTLGQTLRRTA